MDLEEDPPTRPAVELGVGEVLNGIWRLEELIGVGGMGRVFRAEDLKLGRKAAVKAVSIKSLDEDTLQRFERESRVMGKLNHPGIVTLYGVGRSRGIPWLAMRHLEGTSLTAVLKEHPHGLPPDRALNIVRQLCDALGYIHQRSLLHRDLKPSNIHVGSDDRTTLLDLGLARGRKSSLTRTGVVWGTPEYMAPEQISGERELDGRSDLYALAVVLYRMLSGGLPFTKEEDVEVMQQHLSAPRPDISRERGDLPASLGVALQKGMAIHPEDRFQTAAEMLTALEHALADRPRDAPTRATPARASSPRHPAMPGGNTAPVHLGTPTSPLELDARPKGRRTTGEQRAHVPAVDVTPKGRRNTGEQRAHVPLGPPVPDVDITPRGKPVPPKPVSLSLEDDDDGPELNTQKEGFSALDSNSTKRDGFEPLPASVESAPSQSTEKTPAPQPAPPQLPAYLTPPFLIGALVLTLLLGILLGKLL
jgi:serine/threonine protein kinase